MSVILVHVDYVWRVTVRRCGGKAALIRGAPKTANVVQPPKTEIKKKQRDFVDIMISKVLRDLLVSRNLPLKLADD